MSTCRHSNLSINEICTTIVANQHRLQPVLGGFTPLCLPARSSVGSSRSGYSVSTGVTGMTGMSGTSQATECLLSIEEFDESVQVCQGSSNAASMSAASPAAVVCLGSCQKACLS